MLSKQSTGKHVGASKSWAFILTAGLVMSASACGNSKLANPRVDAGTTPTPTSQKLVILHTNDLHSHFMGNAPERDYTPLTPSDDTTTGGLARLASAISNARATAAVDNTPVLLLDGGDFMMGTLFELMALADAPELKFMQAVGYNATTVGNHELDWTPRGFAGILSKAREGGVTVPVLASNMQFDADSPGDDELQELATNEVLKTKFIEVVGDPNVGGRGGLKIGYFGLLGTDAARVTPQATPLTFEDNESAAERMVTELRETDKVDLVIALSHSGIGSDGRGEDADLAAAVPGIDVIVSGHTHETLDAPVTIGNTVIVTAGSYGRYLGRLELTVTPSATPGSRPTVVVNGYTLQNIDDTVPGDEATQTHVDGMIAALDAQLDLAKPGLRYASVVAKTGTDLPLVPRAEAPLGNLIADAYRNISAALDPADPPVVAVEANGQLRASIFKGATGEIWFADLFRVTPLGIGPNQVPGFPLVTFYLNAKDIRAGLELGAASEVVPNDYFLQLSGLKVEYDMSKPFFGRVSSLKLVTGTAEQTLDITNTTQCYKVVTTNYVAGLLSVVEAFTGGALSVAAKDKTCATEVDATTRYVDANPTTTMLDELKQWQAVLTYVSGFPPEAGVPTVPAAYATTQGRITTK